MRRLERFLSRREQLLVLITLILGIVAIGVMWGYTQAQDPPATYARPGGLIGVTEVRDAFASVDRPLGEAGTPVEEGLIALLGPANDPTSAANKSVRAWIWDSPERAATHQQRLSADILGQGVEVQVVDNVVLSYPQAEAEAMIPALSLLAVPAT